MAAQILSFAARVREPLSRDWSSQELAEFYRVESALGQAGLALESERGLTDEGDPWFVFCRTDTGEVFIHFARCDGWYLVDGAALGGPSRGRDFGALVRDLIGRHPLAAVRRPGSNVLMHPAALLIALVGAAFFHSGRAKAAEVAHHDAAAAPVDGKDGRRGLLLGAGAQPPASTGEGSRTVALDAAEVAAVLTGVAIGLRDLGQATPAAAAAASDALATPASTLSAPAPRDLAGRGERSASADMLGALSAQDARAALTVMAVVHDLARSAAAASPASAVATPVVVTTADVSVRADLAAPAPAAPTGGEPGTMLLVHLASGPTPQIEALTIVTADGALARVPVDRVVHVDQLPSFLADLLHGDLGGGGGGGGSGSGGGSSGGPADGAASTTPADGSAVSTDHLPVTPQTAGDALPHVSTSAKVTAADAHAAPTAPAALAPTPAAPLTVSPAPTAPAEDAHAPAAPGHSPLIDAAVLAFVTAVSDVKVVIAGHEVVFYDPQILSALSRETLDSVTWRLEDGSSVSLVGTASELHTFHGLG